MSGLSREVIKWIQSLDLTWQLKSPKWDVTNGYLVAEIFSWYFPQSIEMHMFNNGTSLESKLKNWSLLKNFIKCQKLEIPEEYVEGAIHCKEGAAQLLLEQIFTILTNRSVKKMTDEDEVDFTDRAYQVKLPMHARSTASQAIKNNVRITELMADQSIILSQQKAQHIINRHLGHRQEEREVDPKRFDKHPTLGELCPRMLPQNEESQPSDMENVQMTATPSKKNSNLSKNSIISPSREQSVQFREIKVKQMNSNLHRPTITT